MHDARDNGKPIRLLAAASIMAASGFCGALHAQSQKPEGASPGIFTCTDARGRTLTADRPIAECSDREQRASNRRGRLGRNTVPGSPACVTQ